ncbi:MAG: type II secretion system protein GspC [Halioglobus sp.]
MSSQWLEKTSDIPARLSGQLEGGLRRLMEPARAARLRQLIILLLVLWALTAVGRLVWVLLPQQNAPLPPSGTIINPIQANEVASTASKVNINELRNWHLFGQVGARESVHEVESSAARSATARDGIEENASETRLALKLRGAFAASEDGLGQAIIEYQSKQEVYAVDDAMPVSGKVILAKVMNKQVVLDNGGTYELLTLFEESTLDNQLASIAPATLNQPGKSAVGTGPVKRIESDSSRALAGSYREKLYADPQALTDVVAISAVRDGSDLLGYQIAPGKDVAQFQALGFKTGDVITAVNGIALTDPANTMRLYQTMRTASEAVFDLQRDNQAVTLSVSLDATAAEQ